MQLREELLSEHSKAKAIEISAYIGNDPERFKELVDLLIDGDVKMVQRASYAMSHCTDRFPWLAQPHLPRLIAFAKSPPHVSGKRNVTRLLQDCAMDEEVEGLAYELCWELARSPKEDIAVRACSLTVLGRIAMKYPELRTEVLGVAKDFMQTDSAGLISRAKKGYQTSDLAIPRTGNTACPDTMDIAPC